MKFELLDNYKDLEKYLNKIDNIFPIKSILDSQINKEKVIQYYEDSFFGYKYFHSKQGSVHMALNFDGVFNEEGYLGQVKIISNFINIKKNLKILELGSGKGFNSIFLAKSNTDSSFYGIDITPSHIMTARKNSIDLVNLSFIQCDFQTTLFKNDYFDLIYDVESLCHTSDLKKTLLEIRRILKPKGRLILFDGFRLDEFDKNKTKLEIAARLVEIAMALENEFFNFSEFIELSEEIGFNVIERINLSEAIMPNLKKLQILARGTYKYPKLTKSIMNFIPENLIKNSIAGLFMPFTIRNKIHAYYQIVLEKK